LLVPVAVVVPALVALALVAVVWLTLHAYELISWSEARGTARNRAEPRARLAGLCLLNRVS
jgi:hypothetical protein